MENLVKIFTSSYGDIYHITLFEDTTLLSDNIKSKLQNIKLVGVDLRRLSGNNVTSLSVLNAIEEIVADYILHHDNVMIFYYCDFINPIPKTSKNALPPQEYRSRIFENMFRRYITKNKIAGVHLSVLSVSGIDETYYFHLIYKDINAQIATAISDDIKISLSK